MSKKKDKSFWDKVFKKQARKIKIEPYFRHEVAPITVQDIYILRTRLIFIDYVDQFIQFVEDSNGSGSNESK